MDERFKLAPPSAEELLSMPVEAMHGVFAYAKQQHADSTYGRWLQAIRANLERGMQEEEGARRRKIAEAAEAIRRGLQSLAVIDKGGVLRADLVEAIRNADFDANRSLLAVGMAPVAEPDYMAALRAWAEGRPSALAIERQHLAKTLADLAAG